MPETAGQAAAEGGLWWGVGLSVALAIGSIALAVTIIVRWPPDHFVRDHAAGARSNTSCMRTLALIAKNVLGGVVVLLGIVMALPGIPGQGVLMMIVGVTILDFPGKRRLERRLIARPRILRSINSLRARFNRAAARDGLMGVVGIVVLLGIALLLSVTAGARSTRASSRGGSGCSWRSACSRCARSAGARMFAWSNDAANGFIGFANAGIRFVFGDWPAVAMVQAPGPGPSRRAAHGDRGFVLAVKVLPIIVFIASLMAVLYHLGIMQRIVALLARGLSRSMRISGAEALSTVGDIFLGMTEAPLLIRPYIARMTESELFAVMAAGMATISGSVLLAYVAMGVDAGYLVTASFMSAPAAVMIAKIMVPETGAPETLERGARRGPAPRRQHHRRRRARRQRGAAAGAQRRRDADRVRRAGRHGRRGVGWSAAGSAIPSCRWGASWGRRWRRWRTSWASPGARRRSSASCIGTKTVLNEFIAYQAMTSHLDLLSPKSVRIASFALCGFANFGSLAIVLGGIGGMAPERRSDLARLGVRSIVAGTLATCLSATIAGLVGG